MTKEEKEAYKVNSIANYLHNKNVTEGIIDQLKKLQNIEDESQLDTFIYNQQTPMINKYRCGVVTSSPKGCGWISTYNASKLLGYNLKPEEVIRIYENKGIYVQGFFGIHPFAVAWFFADENADHNKQHKNNVTVSFDDFDNIAKNYEANVMYYDKSPFGHYVAIQYDKKDTDDVSDDVFVGYNVFGDRGDEYEYKTPLSPIKDSDGEDYIGKVMVSISRKEKATVA